MLQNKNLFDIVILTDHRYVKPTKTNWYIDQVLVEDRLLQTALEKKGLKICKKDWADPNFNWTSTKYAILRSTWDYFERFNEFFSWIQETKHKTHFINSSEIINWNIDKHYLKDLANNGLNTTPTIFIEKDNKITLAQLFKKTKWPEVVIKPVISGAARHTYRITQNNYTIYEEIFQRLIKEECMLFQEFMKNITSQGEISLIIIGGKYTHAVRKIAKMGDFRVQDDHGGKAVEYEANDKEIKFAERCVKKCPFSPIYARVDITYDNNNNLSLIELELIEPELWFRNNPRSALLLAEEIFSFISSK
jgi:glutathione synthase/RimK-type ligase-like ATP-grasp enzyme